MTQSRSPSHHSDCAACKHNHPFRVPAAVLEAVKQRRLVIFAGAGVSTEAPQLMPCTFYEDVAIELGLDARSSDRSFPDLMSQYCRQGDGFRKLLQKLRERFDYIESFPALREAATRFHVELSTIPQVENVITTNWDSYFERYCGATPFVSPTDFAFWDMPGRKVFKLHGSVSNYGSIVATKESYTQSHKELTRGVIGGYLKLLLATKTVVFVGYSLRDHDVLRIYQYLQREMGQLLPQAYAVTISENVADRFRTLGIMPIVTDATYFVHCLKNELVAEGVMVPDDRFSQTSFMSWELSERHADLHKAFSCQRNPELIHCASYQDGLTDAFGRIDSQKCTGEYSCPDRVRGLIGTYTQIQKQKRASKKYHDVAYIEGYMNGLAFLLANDHERKWLPFYFVFGYDGSLRTLEQYRRACRHAKSSHRAAYASAVKIARRCKTGVEFHHTPFLL